MESKSSKQKIKRNINRFVSSRPIGIENFKKKKKEKRKKKKEKTLKERKLTNLLLDKLIKKKASIRRM